MAGIYIHIPFCASRCIYCDFFSTTRLEKRSRYVDALCQEMEQRRQEIFSGEEPVSTLYIGGGTPSQLSIPDLHRLFEKIGSMYQLVPDAEVTMECNPEDVTPEFLSELKKTPVNRLSFGIQTFDDRRLQLLRRRHTSRKAIEAVRLSQKAGFQNISIDLIFGFPGESQTDWEDDVRRALALNVQHISAYSLMYEEGTQLTRLRDEGQITPIDEDLSLKMYERLIDLLAEGGYEHYEISNFALPGYRSRHNSSYWMGTPYLGLGAGAHSYDGKRRRWNCSSLDHYIKGVKAGCDYYEIEHLSPADLYNEYVMTRLRTSDGIDLQEFINKFSGELTTYFNEMSSSHLRSGCLETAGGRIRFSKKGLFISDSILSDLFYIEN